MEIKWYRLKDLAVKNFKDVPSDVSGIYFVRWSKNRKPVPISRLGDVDKKGLLYIGSAKKLRRRVRQLWKGINKKGRHTIGKTIIFCRVSDIVNFDECEISWEKLKTHEDAIGQEWAAIKSYADKYKEPPPLNLSIRREFFAVWGIAKWNKSRWAYEPDSFVRSIID